MTDQPKTSVTQCTPCQFREPLGRIVLNSLTAHIAILDGTGVIIETNRAWEAFASRNGATEGSIGVNYLAVCDASTGPESEDAHAVASGIRSVIRRQRDEFLHDYPCHSPTGKHWFYMRAVPMEDGEPLRIVVSHEEITELKLAEEALKQNKLALEEQKRDLEEANIALKVLLKQRENDKRAIEQNVLVNIKQLVFPYIEKLKISRLRPKDKELVGIIDTHLNDIISPMLKRIDNAGILLTPQEMQVAGLVKDGRTSKEISNILNVAETTVHFHRKNLRKKLGIKSKATNLRIYLLSMS
jgi:DNA-binding CsgD family transcriptional regulator